LEDTESHLLPDRGIFPLSELCSRSAREFGTRPAMRIWIGSDYRVITYNELNETATSLARWLIDIGIKRGDRIAVLGENRPEWGEAYLGVQMAGAVVTPVDSLMPPAGIRHILVDSESRILMATPKFLRDVLETAPIPTIEKMVSLGEPCCDGAVSLETVLTAGKASSSMLPERSLDELAALLYTSGTTGYSKGVMLSQRNIISNVSSASRFIHIGPTDVFLAVLPIHHAFECTAGFLLPLYCGASITYARSMKSADLIADIKGTNVTLMVGVPLLYEKLHAGILRNVKKKGSIPRALFQMLYGTSLLGEKVGFDLGVALFRSIREKAGLGSVRLFISGGGPLDPGDADFFNRFGVRMLQGYGLTEASPVTHVNPPWRSRAITVGPPIPGVLQKLADTNDQGVGEVLVKGPNIFVGYFKNPEATNEVMTEDGWLMTGDLGVIHPDGYLQIVGRKKNIIVHRRW